MVLGLLLPSSELSSNPVRSSFDLCPGRVTNSFLWLQKPNSLSFKRECCPLLLCKAAWRCWKWRNLTTSWAPDKQYPMLASHYKHCDVHCGRTLKPQTPPPPPPPQSVQPSYIERMESELTDVWCHLMSIVMSYLRRSMDGSAVWHSGTGDTHKHCPSLTFLPYKLDRTFHFRQVPPTQRSLQGPEEKNNNQSLKHHPRPCHH